MLIDWPISTTVWKSDCGQRNPGSAQLFVEAGPDAGGLESAQNLAVFRDAGLLKQEDVLHGDLLAFHAHQFGDVSDLRRAVAEAGDLHDQIDRRW